MQVLLQDNTPLLPLSCQRLAQPVRPRQSALASSIARHLLPSLSIALIQDEDVK